MTPFTW